MSFTFDDLKKIRPDEPGRYHEFDAPHPYEDSGDVKIRIRRQTGQEYLSLIDSLTDDDGEPVALNGSLSRGDALGQLLFLRCWVDADGKRIVRDKADAKFFNSDEWQQVSPGFLTTVVRESQEFNGVLRRRSLEEAEKNSETTDGSFSPDESPPA